MSNHEFSAFLAGMCTGWITVAYTHWCYGGRPSAAISLVVALALVCLAVGVWVP